MSKKYANQDYYKVNGRGPKDAVHELKKQRFAEKRKQQKDKATSPKSRAG